MGSKKGKFERLSDKAARGEYKLIDPFDYMILGLLPDEGTLMGGYYPIGTSVKTLKERHFPELNSEKISSRFIILRKQGLAIGVGTGSTNSGWQRTAKGKEVYEAWQLQKA